MERHINVMYSALMIISVNISLLIMLADLGMGLSFMYSFRAGSLPKAIAASVSIARLIRSNWITVITTFSPSNGPMKHVRTAATLTVNWKIRNFLMLF